MIVFDIETGPLDTLPPFDPTTVKLGNTKDPEKAAEKIANAEAAYKDKAALSPLTGQVLAIGHVRVGHSAGDCVINVAGQGVGHDDERSLLDWFWRMSLRDEGSVVGFNSIGFDLPFIRRRSLLLGVDTPGWEIDQRGYWHLRFVDLLDVWRCGERNLYEKLDALAAAFGIETKLEGVSGKDFARLWAEDQAKAIAYLEQDVRVTWQLADRMGVGL